MALKKLREMLDSKEISAVELTEQYLDRIEKSDKEINSYITVKKQVGDVYEIDTKFGNTDLSTDRRCFPQ